MRFLCISDVHGDEQALAAVFSAAEKRGFSIENRTASVLVAGDLCFPGPKPLETWLLLMKAGASCVQGTVDLALATLDLKRIQPKNDHERARLQRLRDTREKLGELIVHKLARLPSMLRFPMEDGGELVLVHGSPRDPFEPMTHDMSDAEISALIGDDPADVILCGASHLPFDRTVSGIRIINLGSVGEAPLGIQEEGSAKRRHADLTLLETSPEGIWVEQLSVPIAPAA